MPPPPPLMPRLLGCRMTSRRPQSPVPQYFWGGLAAPPLPFRPHCAVPCLAGGALYAWGSNSDGQLGLGFTGDPIATPVAVGLPPGAVALIAVGRFHNAAVVGVLRRWRFGRRAARSRSGSGRALEAGPKRVNPPPPPAPRVCVQCPRRGRDAKAGLLWNSKKITGRGGEGVQTTLPQTPFSPIPSPPPPFQLSKS